MALENTYAAGLIRAIERGTDVRTATERLAALLKKRGMLSLMPRVIHAVRTMGAQQATHSVITLTVARQSDVQAAQKAASHVIHDLGLESDDIHVVVDDAIVGGWILAGRGVRVDHSHKRHLVDMYQTTVTALQ